MKRILTRIAIVMLAVFMCASGLQLQVRAASPTDGKSYAVLQGSDLIFFRTNNEYEELEEEQTVEDINGKTYTGLVFKDAENGFYSSEQIQQNRWKVEKVYVAENTIIQLKYAAFMFSEMTSMREFNAKGFDTSAVKDMWSMFRECYDLEELDLSSFDTSNVRDFSSMFTDCHELKKLDIGSFDTGNAEEMWEMFDGVYNLEEIKLGPKFTKWDETSVLPHGMWSNGEIELSAQDLCAQYPANAAQWAGTWKNVIAKITNLRLFDAIVAVGDDVGISWTWDPNEYRVSDELIWKSSDESIARMQNENVGIVIGVSPGVATIYATTTDGSDITASCTVKVVDGYACAVLQDNGDLVFLRSYDKPEWDATTVTDIKGKEYHGIIFHYIENGNHDWSYDDSYDKIKKAYVAEGSTIYLSEMSCYFLNCSNLTEADLKGFDTEMATRFDYLFEGCSSLQKVDMSTIVIDEDAYVYDMFSGCENLTELILGPEIKTLRSASLPRGNWTNGSIKKSADELCEEYAKHASEWAGKWTRKIVPATSIKFTQDVFEIEQGYAYELEYILTPEDASSGLAWESSDTSIVDIWENGTVVGNELGTATITVRTTDGTNLSATCTVKVIERQERFYAYRISGSNRYKTSLEIAKVYCEWWGEETVENVILACGSNFADALAGSYLSAVKHAPIIIVNDANIDIVKKYVKNYLAEKGTIYILGGPVAVSEKVEKEMKKISTVKRLAGNNRYGTNLEILNAAGMDSGIILVATGTNFADSLSASATGYPMLLVRDSLNDEQKAFLKKNSGKEIYILGGTKAVNSSVEKELSKYGTVKRIAGDSRFETSVMIAEKFFNHPYGAMVAYSNDYPDGLCGGPLGVKEGIPLILTRSDNLTAAQKYIKDNDIHYLDVLGGTSRLTDKDIDTLFSKKLTKIYSYEYED